MALPVYQSAYRDRSEWLWSLHLWEPDPRLTWPQAAMGDQRLGGAR